MPIRQRLRNMDARDGRGACEIGNNLRRAQHPREAPHREVLTPTRLLGQSAGFWLHRERPCIALSAQRTAPALALVGLGDAGGDEKLLGKAEPQPALGGDEQDGLGNGACSWGQMAV